MKRPRSSGGPAGIPAPENHDVLDLIADRLKQIHVDHRVSRESECVEFRDPFTGQWYEIIVRAIDEPSREG
jgi:hypothetical protein